MASTPNSSHKRSIIKPFYVVTALFHCSQMWIQRWLHLCCMPYPQQVRPKLIILEDNLLRFYIGSVATLKSLRGPKGHCSFLHRYVTWVFTIYPTCDNFRYRVWKGVAVSWHISLNLCRFNSVNNNFKRADESNWPRIAPHEYHTSKYTSSWNRRVQVVVDDCDVGCTPEAWAPSFQYGVVILNVHSGDFCKWLFLIMKAITPVS